MKPLKYCSFALLALLPISLHAETPDVGECQRIEDDLLRLACYDEHFGRPATADDALQDVIVMREPQPVAVAETATGAAAAEAFGAENVINTDIDEIESRLVGDFDGWSGRTIFTLENGQVWRQTKNYIRDYRPREPIPQPKVTISRGVFGSYNMRIEGVKRIVQVKRIE